jgi:Reverse transcriptase (RNA-dependent DNA polymerase)
MCYTMKFDEVMATNDAPQWEKTVDKEHDRMVKSNVFQVTPIEEVPEGATVLRDTWAMKKKSNGVFQVCVTAQGFEQIDGEYNDSMDIASPVVLELTICIVLILIMMAGWYAMVIMDVIGAFLLGDFNPKHKMYMRVPKGFQKFYPEGVVLLLLKKLYGAKQTAMAFWRKLFSVLFRSNLKRSQAVPCLHYKGTDNGLTLWVL